MNYEKIVCDANNLYRAYKASVKTSKWKETTQKFMMNFLMLEGYITAFKKRPSSPAQSC